MKNLTIRLDSYLAQAGIVSRRGVTKLLQEKNVEINGQKVTENGVRIDPSKQKITIDGKEIKSTKEFVYIMLNKPFGAVSTVSDDKNRKTVVDLVVTQERVYPVGRLDHDSIGLVLLTNDGDLAYKLTHPKFEVPKTYEVIVSGKVSDNQLYKLRSGIRLKEGITQPAKVKRIGEYPATTKLRFIIKEGRNRQIRRMCGSVDLNVLELKRVALGSLNLGDLEIGKYRELTLQEIESLKAF